MKCSSCGFDSPAENAFCPKCGLPLASTPVVITHKTKSPFRAARLAIPLLALIVALGVGGAFFRKTFEDTHENGLPSALNQITYAVTGEGVTTAEITITNQSGGVDQRLVDLPWNATFNAPSGAFIYVAAQKKTVHGSLQVKISVNGNVLQEADSNAAYGIATASGQVP